MNWRRGLFRVWLAASVLFAAAVFIVTGNEIYSEFRVTPSEPLPAVPLLPIRCEEVRGRQGVDFVKIARPASRFVLDLTEA